MRKCFWASFLLVIAGSWACAEVGQGLDAASPADHGLWDTGQEIDSGPLDSGGSCAVAADCPGIDPTCDFVEISLCPCCVVLRTCQEGRCVTRSNPSESCGCHDGGRADAL